MKQFHNTHHHICFSRNWQLSEDTAILLGECISLIKAISNTAIMPKNRKRLLNVSLIKGAQATTAIEGNTLTIKEIENIQNGVSAPPSKEYLKQEVENIIKAFNYILTKLILERNIELITPELIKQFHKMIGENIGEAFNAIPGKFRTGNVTVAYYKAPGYDAVPEMVNKLCKWLRDEFKFGKIDDIKEAIIQAIVTHLYLAWIHPFTDGNGRTARLLEFYILMRAGVPDIASHILSNHYNQTRVMYFRQIELTTEENNIEKFIHYALEGFRDGLTNILEEIQQSQLEIAWRSYIFETFDSLKKRGTLNRPYQRRRELIHSFPLYHNFKLQQFEEIKEIAVLYKSLSIKTLFRDIKTLCQMELLREEENGYVPNIDKLRTRMALRISIDNKDGK